MLWLYFTDSICCVIIILIAWNLVFNTSLQLFSSVSRCWKRCWRRQMPSDAHFSPYCTAGGRPYASSLPEVLCFQLLVISICKHSRRINLYSASDHSTNILWYLSKQVCYSNPTFPNLNFWGMGNFLSYVSWSLKFPFCLKQAVILFFWT